MGIWTEFFLFARERWLEGGNVERTYDENKINYVRQRVLHFKCWVECFCVACAVILILRSCFHCIIMVIYVLCFMLHQMADSSYN